MLSINRIQEHLVDFFDISCSCVREFSVVTDTPSFVFEARNSKFFLKIFSFARKEETHFEDDYLCFLNSIEFLRGRVPSVEKVFSREGFVFVVYHFIIAEPLKPVNLTGNLLAEIAKLHANIHDASSLFMTLRKRVRTNLFDISCVGDLKRNGKIEEGIYKYMENFSKDILPKRVFLPKTMIHEDLSCENILLKGNVPIFVDFGESHLGYRVSDIAILITELFVNESIINFEGIKDYIRCYNQYASKKLNSSERETLAFAVLKRALFMLNYCMESHRDFPAVIYRNWTLRVRNIWEHLSVISLICTTS